MESKKDAAHLDGVHGSVLRPPLWLIQLFDEFLAATLDLSLVLCCR